MNLNLSNPDELDEIDRGRFELFMWGVLRQMESFHVQFEQGIIEEAAMKAYSRLSVDLINSNKLIQQHWQDSRNYSLAFKSWVDKQIAQLAHNSDSEQRIKLRGEKAQ